jgi:hypothetical protein
MDALLAAIYGKISGSALSSDVGGRVYLDEAPAGCEFPYVVYFVVSSTPDDVFCQKGKQTLIQFSLFSANTSAVEVADLYDSLRTLFDDAFIEISIHETDGVRYYTIDGYLADGSYLADGTYFAGYNDILLWMHEVNLTTMVEDITTAEGVQSVKHWAADYEVVTQES